MTVVPENLTTQVYRVFIKASAQQVWDAITQPEFIARFFHGGHVESDLVAGGHWRTYAPDRSLLWNDGRVLEVDPPRRLVHTWQSAYDPEMATEPSSRVSGDIEERPEGWCMLTLIHDQLDESPKTATSVSGAGWMFVLSNLKTMLETGTTLDGG